ncbi:hypothetical protein TraAM80_05259 [Trypanosoma rangeli]|uniref:Uncharacterized protein n=1 Tax=Trypanosoma rangeli TaxID=5698 RepID=A0A3R7NLF4_TRYRA|nr:uncharacterized protein TraAM80_05259 [Trypanosoma rangeli]RNF04380.1 hypothetical protein TraAM80_05259 [Trypanosoma rangeli]|eukprot:RNF04380.1 hypothetical protein TraAM80_05259 [Trypanosoma rangeli]
MLHFRAVKASVWDGGDEATCAALPLAWRHASRTPSSSCPPQSTSAGHGLEVAPGVYERLVGIEFIGSCYTSGSLQETVLTFRSSEGRCVLDSALAATAATSSSSSSSSFATGEIDVCDGGGGGGRGGGATLSVVYFMTLLVASCNGSDTSIEAVRCAFCGAEDDRAAPEAYAADTAPPSPCTLEEALMDREPDLLLQYLWDLLQSGTCPLEQDTEGSFLSPTAASASYAPTSSSSFQLIDRTPLLLRAGVLDVVQASLTTPPSCMPTSAPPTTAAMTPTRMRPNEASGHSCAAGGARGGSCEEAAAAGTAYHGLMLSFTERLETRTAVAAMPEGERHHERRSFASLRRFLQRRTDAAAAAPLAAATDEACDMAPYRYFVWLHVVGTGLFYEATVTEKISVPLSVHVAGLTTTAASSRSTSTTRCRGLAGEAAAQGHEEVGSKAEKEEERDPLGRATTSTPAPRQASLQSDVPPGEAGGLTVVSLPANAFFQAGYFLKRKATDATQQRGERGVTTTFYWISACDYAKQGLQVKEVSYVQEGDTSSGAGAFRFIGFKGESRHQKQQHARGRQGGRPTSAPFAVVERRTLEVRSAAQWSLAQYPKWHHWDPVTQRLSFWAAFPTYDKLRIVAFHGHPDQRRCEFERNIPRRRHTFSSAPFSAADASLARHDDVAEVTRMPMPLVVERGFGVSGAPTDTPRSAVLRSGAVLLEPWGTACCSALSRMHLTLVPVQYEDGARDSILCEQIFLSCDESRTAASREALQQGIDVSQCVSTGAVNDTDDRRDCSRTQEQLSMTAQLGDGTHIVRCVEHPPSDAHREAGGTVASAPQPPRPATCTVAVVEPGPPAILCTITALRNYVDAVKVTIPLTPDERCRITYDTRVSFLFIKGMIAIYLPGVCVHYVDVHHMDTPPRYLFGVRLHPPAYARSEALSAVIGVAATPAPLVSYLPVPFGRWLYVPGTVILFEAALHPSSVWRFIRRYLIRRRLCRVRASGVPAVGVSVITPHGCEGACERCDRPCEAGDGNSPRDFAWQRLAPVAPTPCDTPAAVATFLQPAPLHFAVHVALTHLQPLQQQGENDVSVDSPLSSAPPQRCREPAPSSSERFHPPASASSLQGWEEIWAARDAQLERVFAAYLSSDMWRDISVELLSVLVLSEAYARVRAVCCWRPAHIWKEGAAEASSVNGDTSASTAAAMGLCSPYFVCLPLWDPAGLAAEETQYRREFAAFYRAWRLHQQRQRQDEEEEEEAGMMHMVSESGSLPHGGMSPAATRQLQEGSPDTAAVSLTPALPLPRSPQTTTTTGGGRMTTTPAAQCTLSPERMPPCPGRHVSRTLYAPVKSGNGFSPETTLLPAARRGNRGFTQSRPCMEGDKKTAVLSSLLVHAVSFRGTAVVRQQCHNTVPEWWLVHGACMQPAPPRSPRMAPHLLLLFTSRNTLDGDIDNARGTSLLHRIKGAFKHSQGSCPPSTSAALSRYSFSSSSLASMTPVGRVSLPAFSAASFTGAESFAGGTSEGVSSSRNFTGSTTFVSSSAFRVSADSSTRLGRGEGGSLPATNLVATATLPQTQSATSVGSVPLHTGGASVSTAAHSPSVFVSPLIDRVRHTPFDGPSCGTAFVEVVLAQLQLLVKTSPAGHAPRPAPAGVQRPPEQGSHQLQQPKHGRGRALEAPVSSRFLTPAAASSFVSLLEAGAALTTTTAAHLELLALLYDAAVASVVNALVRIATSPHSSSSPPPHPVASVVNSGVTCSHRHESATLMRGQMDVSGFLLARWSFGQRLALALERLGVPPSLDLVEGLAREGLRQFPTRAVIAGQRCGAFEGVTLSLLLRHQPSLAALLRKHVVAFAPQLSHELGLISAPAARPLHDIVTPAEEQALTETIRQALYGDTAMHRAAATTPSFPSRSGYRDAGSPTLALQPAHLPRLQARMLFLHLLTHATVTPQEVTLPCEGVAGAFTQTAPPCEQKRHVMAVLDPAPYLQRGDEGSIPYETEFASPFPPFQRWWRQRRQRGSATRNPKHGFTWCSMNIANSRNSKLLFTTPPSSSASCVHLPPSIDMADDDAGGEKRNRPAATSIIHRPSEVITHEGCSEELQREVPVALATPPSAPVDSSFSTLAPGVGLPLNEKHKPDMLRGTISLVSLCEPSLAWSEAEDGGMRDTHVESQETAAADATALLPLLLAATPLGYTIAKERARAAMAVVLDPFFKGD